MSNIIEEKGFLLSEYGLFYRNTDERIVTNSEEEIYEILGVAYPDPSDGRLTDLTAPMGLWRRI